MKTLLATAALLVSALLIPATASADNDFGIGVKAGTLGLGAEATWRPLPFFDIRLGVNAYDYNENGAQAGVEYDATLALDNYYGTLNLHFPVSPFRITAGAYANGNELQLQSNDDDAIIVIGGVPYDANLVGTLSSVTSFGSTAPYAGVGFDFTVLGKVGLNLDFGVLWQGDPEVTLAASGPLASDPSFQTALEAERQELVDEVEDYKAWPVVSLGFVYNF